MVTKDLGQRRRAERLEAQLRANLKRRKDQSRARVDKLRASGDGDDGDAADGAPDQPVKK